MAWCVSHKTALQSTLLRHFFWVFRVYCGEVSTTKDTKLTKQNNLNTKNETRNPNSSCTS